MKSSNGSATTRLGGHWLALVATCCGTVLGIEDPRRRVDCDDASCGGGGAAGMESGSGASTPTGGSSGGLGGMHGDAGQSGADEGGHGASTGGARGGAGTGASTSSDGGQVGTSGSGGQAGTSTNEGGQAGSSSGGQAGTSSGGLAGTSSDGGRAGAAGGNGGDDGPPPECEEGAARCTAYQPQHCVSGAWRNDVSECAEYCQDGDCKTARSCAPGSGTTSCVDGAGCCDTIWLPAGDYEMGSGDEEDPDVTYQRSVKAFYLDRFEVTVGRFASFVAVYATPAEGGGENPRVPGSGWSKTWEGFENLDYPGEKIVPRSVAELLVQIGATGHCGAAATWGGDDQTLPINCVNWYVAFAFCAFDGGRLPTEAEWNYAAAHGNEHRPYPWSESVGDLTIDPSRARYFKYPDVLPSPSSVGAHPLGRGGFFRHSGQGHDDLAGNVAEWVADQWLDEPASACEDCLPLWTDIPIGDTDEHLRVTRGGGYRSGPEFLRTGSRTYSSGFNAISNYGFRCARDLMKR